MKKKKKLTAVIFTSLIIVMILLTVRIMYSKKSLTNDDSNLQSDIVNSSDDKAPELKNNGKWINTDSDLNMESLKGKVVLLEFWTFGCYNCVNTLPYLKDWYGKYKSDEFEMIGVHCPEFDNERNFDNVKSNVKKLGIEYPVLTDNEFSVWKNYDVHAWPTIILIDKKGEIRYTTVGEGSYDKTEEMIRSLLKESAQ